MAMINEKRSPKETERLVILLATSGSLALLLGALGFQFIGDMPPCKLCIWQRWPHVIAVLIGVLFLLRPRPLLALLGALATLSTAGIGLYHAGVEQKWWPGPDTCTAGPVSGLSADELFEKIMNTPLVRCDEIPWQLFGISMAGWNAIISTLLAILWLAAFRASIKAR